MGEMEIVGRGKNSTRHDVDFLGTMWKVRDGWNSTGEVIWIDLLTFGGKVGRLCCR